MVPTRDGSVRLFRFAGVDVFVHWSWFIVAFYQISTRERYSAVGWVAAEYVALFGLVLLHEYGHALACRQTGGRADQIVLWPLGGVAYVEPPPRPGATLWSIAAGPLVNLLLAPLLFGGLLLARELGWFHSLPNVYNLLKWVTLANAVMLCFNLLPIYPLDGGQIVRSLLWFFMGPWRSLMAASVVGLAGVALLIGLAFLARNIWLGIMAAFILVNCWGALTRARVLGKMARLPRRTEAACPACGTAPLLAPVWRCGKCGAGFDVFETAATCPRCGEQSASIPCHECGNSRAISEWVKPPILN